MWYGSDSSWYRMFFLTSFFFTTWRISLGRVLRTAKSTSNKSTRIHEIPGCSTITQSLFLSLASYVHLHSLTEVIVFVRKKAMWVNCKRRTSLAGSKANLSTVISSAHNNRSKHKQFAKQTNIMEPSGTWMELLFKKHVREPSMVLNTMTPAANTVIHLSHRQTLSQSVGPAASIASTSLSCGIFFTPWRKPRSATPSVPSRSSPSRRWSW